MFHARFDAMRRDAIRSGGGRARARTRNADYSVLWVSHDNNRSHDRHGHEPVYDRVSSDRKRVAASSRSREYTGRDRVVLIRIALWVDWNRGYSGNSIGKYMDDEVIVIRWIEIGFRFAEQSIRCFENF